MPEPKISLAYLDGLRAYAAFYVLFYHVYPRNQQAAITIDAIIGIHTGGFRHLLLDSLDMSHNVQQVTLLMVVPLAVSYLFHSVFERPFMHNYD